MYSKSKQKILGSVMTIILFANIFVMFVPEKANAFGLGGSGGASGGLSQSAGPILGAGISCGLNLLANKLIKNGKDKVVGGLTGSVTVTDSSTNYFTGKVDTKLNCLNKIGKAAAQVLLKKITLATVNWINTGFKGAPLFVRNPLSLAKSIGEDEINNFRLQIEGNGPFGKAIAQSLIGSVKGYFGFNTQYSLNAIIGMAPAERFRTDFSAGGWAGWYGTILYPQNNPIGATIEASNELSQKLAGLGQSKINEVQSQLQRNEGFLDLKRCADTGFIENSTAKAEAYNKLLAAQQALNFYTHPGSTVATNYVNQSSVNGGANNNDIYFDVTNPQYIALKAEVDNAQAEYNHYVCSNYATTTPGGYASQALYGVMNSPLHQLEFGQDLDASLTAIFDALLNQAINKGVDTLAGSNNNGVSTFFGGEGNNGDAVANNGGGGHWSTSTDTFDIDTDLSKIIRLQDDFYFELSGIRTGVARTYKGDTDGYIGGPLPTNHVSEKEALEANIYAIKTADFALPGPRPDWFPAAQETLMTIVASYTPSPDDGDNKAIKYYAGIIRGVLGMNVDASNGNGDAGVKDLNTLVRWFNRTLSGSLWADSDGQSYYISGYKNYINERFSMAELPLQAPDVYGLYYKISGYEENLNEIQSQLALTRSIINRLDKIRSEIKDAKIAGSVDQNNHDYDNLLRTFQTIAPDLVGQEAISQVQSETKQLLDEANYARELTFAVRKEVDGIDKNGTFVGTNYQGPKERMPYPGIRNDFPGNVKDHAGFLTYSQEAPGIWVPTFLPNAYFGGDNSTPSPSLPSSSPECTKPFPNPRCRDNYDLHMSDVAPYASFGPGAPGYTMIENNVKDLTGGVQNKLDDLMSLINVGRGVWYFEKEIGMY